MTPQLFTGKNVIIQGITGKNGRFHAQNMLNYKTHIVAGTSPNQAVSEVHGVPVFRTISDIKKRFAIDISVIFVPAPYAKAAILEAIQAQIPLIICITEGVPVHDMLEIKQKLRRSRSVFSFSLRVFFLPNLLRFCRYTMRNIVSYFHRLMKLPDLLIGLGLQDE